MDKDFIIQALWEIQLEEYAEEQIKKIEHEEMQEQILEQLITEHKKENLKQPTIKELFEKGKIIKEVELFYAGDL